MIKLIKILLLVITIMTSFNVMGQDCPEPTAENYKKVMSSAFYEDYTDCPVTIEGVYFKDGYAKSYRKPKKLNKMYFFQCLADDGVPSTNPLSQDQTGDFFVIDKSLADKALELKNGDKLRLTGTTYQQNYFGQKLHIFFIVSDLEKL